MWGLMLFSTLDPEALRGRAEALARQDQSGPVGVGEPGGPDALKQTLHALHVYQIELEMQNDELRQAQIKLEIQNEELRQFQIDLKAANVRYFDFYDLAPVAYCTLDAHGLILEANRTAAKMLGVPKKAAAPADVQPVCPPAGAGRFLPVSQGYPGERRRS